MVGANPYASNEFCLVKFEPHLHTLHSDGQDTVAAMFAACRSAGYEAVALTDHNTLSGLPEAETAAAELGLILIPGVEVTTFRGHAVVLGVSSMPEWRDLEARGMDALAAEVHAQAGLLSVAHASALGSPVCSGCAWEWPVQAASVDLWEVFNGARLAAEVPLALWREQLAGGGHIAPIAAGDVHSVAAARKARPSTCVYVRDRSTAGVLESLRARRLFASWEARLDLWLEHPDGRTAMVGESVHGDGWTAHTHPSAEVRTVVCGQQRQCVYAELRDDHAELVAITAPIWISTSH